MFEPGFYVTLLCIPRQHGEPLAVAEQAPSIEGLYQQLEQVGSRRRHSAQHRIKKTVEIGVPAIDGDEVAARKGRATNGANKSCFVSREVSESGPRGTIPPAISDPPSADGDRRRTRCAESQKMSPRDLHLISLRGAHCIAGPVSLTII